MPVSAGRHPEQGEGDVGAPRSNQSGEAEHLAAAKLERDVGEHPVQAERFDLREHLAFRVLTSGEEVGGITTHHLPDQ